MVIQLKLEQERKVQELIKSGRLQSLDQLIDKALESLSAPRVTKEERMSRARASAARIRRIRKALSLYGLKTKDLIEEGRM